MTSRRWPALTALAAGLMTEAGLRLLYAGAPVLGQRLGEAHGTLALLALLLVIAARPLHLTSARRTLGLSAAAYTALHLGYTSVHVLGGEVEGLLFLRPAEQFGVALGVLAAAGLVPLALTSTGAARRRLGPTWTRLHAITPALLMLAAGHALWTGVHGAQPVPSALLLLLPLAALWTRQTARTVHHETPAGPARPHAHPARHRS